MNNFIMSNWWEYDFFGHNHPPRKPEGKKSEMELPLSAKEMEARQKFFGGDLLTILGQWPIKKIPKYNNTHEVKEPITPEMEEEIKNMFLDFPQESSMLQN